MITVNSIYINANYDNLKHILMCEWRKISKAPFDEDIFHDTLLKCMSAFENKPIKNDGEFKAYLVSAFKNNIFRDKAYHRNAKSMDIDVEAIQIPINPISNIDKDIIIEAVKKRFGEIPSQQFEDWMNGGTIQRINTKYNCTNARYTIENISKFVFKTFGKELKR